MTVPAASTAGERAGRLALALVLAGYLVLAVQYAVRTPPWQAPDEPAHFNYVRQLAANPADLPEIQAGDWDAARLEQLKATGFPAGESIAGIEYEDHQAPAWYYLASVVYRLAPTGELDRLLALRLLNVLVGALGVALIWLTVRQGWPDDPVLAVAAAGFAAFLPMRLAVVASASNDPLAEVVCTAAVCLAWRRGTGRCRPRVWTWGGGALLGLAFLTKVSAYATIVVLAAGEIAAWWRRGRRGTAMAASAVARQLAVGLAIGLPWFARNATVYGRGDWMGRAAHDAVVSGQPTTAEWIIQHGLVGQSEALLPRMATWTFESFWGVFGWMGVFLSPRWYQLLALAALVAGVGLVVYLDRLRRADGPLAGTQRTAVWVMAVALVAAVAGYLWWNLAFVQHQGRYLFPALVAIATGFMLGLRQWSQATVHAARRDRWGPAAEVMVLGGFCAGLAGLAYLSLVRFIVPGLR